MIGVQGQSVKDGEKKANMAALLFDDSFACIAWDEFVSILRTYVESSSAMILETIGNECN